MFKTSGSMDEKTIKDVYFKTLPARAYLIVGAFTVVSVIMIVACFFEKSVENIRLYIIGLVLFWGLLIARFFSVRNKAIEKLRSTGRKDIKFTSSFTEDKIHLLNNSNGSSTTVNYKIFNRIVETDTILFLLTKRSQFVPVFKDQLKPGEREQLIEFLKTKGTAIRKWG